MAARLDPPPSPPPPPTVDDTLERQIQGAWATLLDRADVIADDITVNLIAKEREWYDLAGPEIRAEVRSSTREHVRRGLHRMAGQHTARTTTELWRETGRRRARQNVPLEFMLNAYIIGTRVLWEALMAEQARGGLDDHALLLAGRQLWSALDVQNSVMSAAYRKESSRLQRRDLQRQGRLLDALAEGRGGDPAYAAEVTDLLGIAVDEPVLCVVAAYDGQRDTPLRNPDDVLENSGVTSYWQVRGDHHFGLVQLGDATVEQVVDLLGECAAGRVGVAPASDGLRGFATAFQLATHTLETVPRGTVEVASVEERLPQVLLAASPATAALLVHRTLGPVLALPPHQRDVLLETLRALLDHGGSPTHAAEQLYCHRNTVIYRMRQLQDLISHKIADPGDRLLLTLALMAM